MRWQANACRTLSGGSAAGACATRTGSTALGAGQRSANVSACASVAVQIAATVSTARLAITSVSYRLPRDETVDLGVLSPHRLRPADVQRRKHRDAGMHNEVVSLLGAAKIRYPDEGLAYRGPFERKLTGQP